MTHEHKFIGIAVRESNFPNTARGAVDAAEIRVMGGIAQNFNMPFTRDDYIKAGLVFLDEFAQTGKQEIALLAEELETEKGDDEARDECLREVICEIYNLIRETSEIDRNEFAELVGEDYDAQYGR